MATKELDNLTEKQLLVLIIKELTQINLNICLTTKDIIKNIEWLDDTVERIIDSDYTSNR